MSHNSSHRDILGRFGQVLPAAALVILYSMTACTLAPASSTLASAATPAPAVSAELVLPPPANFPARPGMDPIAVPSLVSPDAVALPLARAVEPATPLARALQDGKPLIVLESDTHHIQVRDRNTRHVALAQQVRALRKQVPSLRVVVVECYLEMPTHDRYLRSEVCFARDIPAGPLLPPAIRLDEAAWQRVEPAARRATLNGGSLKNRIWASAGNNVVVISYYDGTQWHVAAWDALDDFFINARPEELTRDKEAVLNAVGVFRLFQTLESLPEVRFPIPDWYNLKDLIDEYDLQTPNESPKTPSAKP